MGPVQVHLGRGTLGREGEQESPLIASTARSDCASASIGAGPAPIVLQLPWRSSAPPCPFRWHRP